MAFDVITPVKLGQAAITTVLATLYTCPVGARALLKEFNIVNTTAGAITARVYIVPSGGSAGTGNAFVYDASIAANGNYQYNGIQVMNAGDFIQVQAASAGLTITASGAESV